MTILNYLLMMQIVKMSTSVEFKTWSMCPLIAVPLINQSQLISTEESEVCDGNGRLSNSIVLKN